MVILQIKLFTPTSQINQLNGLALKITNAQQQEFIFDVEIADTVELRSRGLMFRENLADNQGMLFVFPEASILNFYMKNTYLSLDIIFIDASKTIVDIHEQVPPLQEYPLITSNQPCLYALEIPAGTAKRLGIAIGDKISY